MIEVCKVLAESSETEGFANENLPIKLLIVDDEMLVRIGISSLVDWEKYGFRIIGSVNNGIEALEIIEKEMPDIILTDIIMPKMNGIELLKVINQKYPFIKTVVLSCHDDIDYVKNAIKLGAEDYVSKLTMTPDEVLTLLIGIVDEIRKNEQKNSIIKPTERILRALDDESKKYIIRCLLDDDMDISFITDTLNRIHPDLVSENKVLALVKIHLSPSAGKNTSRMHEKGLLQLIESKLPKSIFGFLSAYPDQQYAALLILKAQKDENMQSHVCDMLRHVIVSARRFMNIYVSIGLSKVFLDMSSCRTAYSEASNALLQSFYSENEGVYVYSEDFFLNDKEAVLPPEDELELSEIIENCNIPAISATIAGLFEKIEKQRLDIEICRKILLETIYHFISLLKRHGKSVNMATGDTLDIYQSLLSCDRFLSTKEIVLRCVDEYIAAIHNAESKYRQETKEIVEYMRNHYQEPISLKWAAQYVHMSESHFSRVFKEETGKCFIQYLNELRLKKAVDLLDTTELPSYLISEMVGYDNPNYFGRIFKKSIGISPTLFKKRKKSN